MMLACLLSVLTAIADVLDQKPTPEDVRSYQEMAAAVGRDADSHVNLALWCEARGLHAERTRHLMRAVLLSPEHQAARGLLGMVKRDGRWVRPDDVRSALEDDAQASSLMRNYLSRRVKAAPTPDAQFKLAVWCEANGLKEQAGAHFRSVVRMDPDRDAAWKRLGYKKSGSGWSRPEDVAAEKARAEADRKAYRRWKPELEKLRDRSLVKDDQARLKAEEALDSITDPQAVPSIWDVFVRDEAALQRRAAEMFARIDGRSASLALAELAVRSPIAEVRGLAAGLLERRDPRDYLDPLLELVRKPFRYKVRPVGVGVEGGVYAEGQDYNIVRLYQVFPTDRGRMPRRLFTDDVPLMADPRSTLVGVTAASPFVTWSTPRPIPAASAAALPAGTTALLNSATQKAARGSSARPNPFVAEAIRRDQEIAQGIVEERDRLAQAQQALSRDVAWIESFNDGVRDVNERVLPVVRAAAGRDFGDDRDAWKRWWSDELGYMYESASQQEKPTYTEVISVVSPRSVGGHGACFAAGTKVQTLTGPAAIEMVSVGDLVLSQDVTTGEVSYKPVLVTHRNAPTSTLRLTIGSETIVATGIHRFWKPALGWTMARDLKAGDLVRAIGGTQVVAAVEQGPTEPVYNLDVSENLDFFVGSTGFLVHDFSIVREPARPFDAAGAPSLAVAARR